MSTTICEWIRAVGDEESCRVTLSNGVVSLRVQDEDSIAIIRLNLTGIDDLIRALTTVRATYWRSK